MRTKIINGKVVTATQILQKDLWVEDGRFCAPQDRADQTIDAKGDYILPGLIDLHTHGSAGVNFSKDTDFRKALDFYASSGVTTVFPTVGVRPMEELKTAIATVRAEKERLNHGAKIGGIHLEGPFVNAGKKGAMSMPDIPCTIENFKEIVEAGDGQIRIMTIAPEVENAKEVIRLGAQLGIRMSIGHTDADNADAHAAADAGATGATHTFNAMRSLDHRDPGVLGVVLTDRRITCEVICDTVHVAPEIIHLIALCKGKDKMILVSDSGMITGLGDGEYLVDGKIRIVKDKICRNREGRLAGSCYTMTDGAKKLLELGFDLCDIARFGAQNPAAAAGLSQEIGSLELGRCADFFLCDQFLNIHDVYIRGTQFV